jgi:hypothetical protein
MHCAKIQGSNFATVQSSSTNGSKNQAGCEIIHPKNRLTIHEILFIVPLMSLLLKNLELSPNCISCHDFFLFLIYLKLTKKRNGS